MGAPHHIRDQADDARHLIRLKSRHWGHHRTSAAFTDVDWDVGRDSEVARARRGLGDLLDTAVRLFRSGDYNFSIRFRNAIKRQWSVITELGAAAAELEDLNVFLEKFSLRLTGNGSIIPDPAAVAKWQALAAQIKHLSVELEMAAQTGRDKAVRARDRRLKAIASAKAGIGCVRLGADGQYYEVELATLLKEAEHDEVHQLEARVARLKSDLAAAKQRDQQARLGLLKL